jgi:hypothetical protein
MSEEKTTPNEREKIDQLVSELNTLAEELRRTIPSYAPPPYSPQALSALLKENLHRFTPDLQSGLLADIKNNLEGTTPQDLVNPDTWKGLWYIVNYSLQAQSEQAKEKLASRLAMIPGASVLLDLKSNFEGAKPSDFLDINTWKGVFYILDHTVRHQMSEAKKKLLGEQE